MSETEPAWLYATTPSGDAYLVGPDGLAWRYPALADHLNTLTAERDDARAKAELADEFATKMHKNYKDVGSAFYARSWEENWLVRYDAITKEAKGDE